MSNDLANELRAAWAKIDALKALLRDLEWSGETVVYYDGVTALCCPSCGGIKPGETLYDSERDGTRYGHTDACELVAALAAP
jgi:hypothetical protein